MRSPIRVAFIDGANSDMENNHLNMYMRLQKLRGEVTTK